MKLGLLLASLLVVGCSPPQCTASNCAACCSAADMCEPCGVDAGGGGGPSYAGPYLWTCDYTLTCIGGGVGTRTNTYYGGEWCERNGSDAQLKTKNLNCAAPASGCSCTTYCTKSTSGSKYIKC